MKKKVVVGCIITVLVIIIFALSIALIFALNKNGENNVTVGKMSAAEETIVTEFIDAVKSEIKMKNFIEKNFDFRACFAVDKTMYKDEVPDGDELKKIMEYHYNNPDESEIKETADTWTGAYYNLIINEYDLTLKDIQGPYEYNNGFEFEDVVATYTNKDGQDLSFTFTFYHDKVVMIAAPESSYQNYSISFTQKDGVNYRDDFSAFGYDHEHMANFFEGEVKERVDTETGYVLILNNGIKCYYELDKYGYVNYMDVYTVWEPGTSSDAEKEWFSTFTKFIKTLGYNDYDLIKSNMVNLIDEMEDELSYDADEDFPQELYDDYRTYGNSKFEIAAQGLSETEVEINFVITPIED